MNIRIEKAKHYHIMNKQTFKSQSKKYVHCSFKCNVLDFEMCKRTVVHQVLNDNVHCTYKIFVEIVFAQIIDLKKDIYPDININNS